MPKVHSGHIVKNGAAAKPSLSLDFFDSKEDRSGELKSSGRPLRFCCTMGKYARQAILLFSLVWVQSSVISNSLKRSVGFVVSHTDKTSSGHSRSYCRRICRSEITMTISQVSIEQLSMLSVLKKLRCGEIRETKEVQNPGSMNRIYNFLCENGNFSIKINGRLSAQQKFEGEAAGLKVDIAFIISAYTARLWFFVLNFLLLSSIAFRQCASRGSGSRPRYGWATSRTAGATSSRSCWTSSRLACSTPARSVS